jgi:meso-butanediol dehydrogenase/(S,S)-butanediol dehydrogenase/diacetyl reductase
MNKRLEGKIAWVTGGGRGIGRSIALALGAQGASVAISSRTQAELEAVAAAIREAGGRALAVRADAMSFDELHACAATIRDRLGPVDILVNNAGGGASVENREGMSALKLDDLRFVADIELNLISAYRASSAVLPTMVQRGYGRIINIGSGYSKRSGGGPAYTAAKHGLVGLTRSLAAYVATKGVTINCLCPGWTNTKLVDLETMAGFQRIPVAEMRERIESENLQHRILEPDELGPMAVLLASHEAAGITGQVISVDGGYKV